MREYRGRDGKEQFWIDVQDVERTMESELQRARLMPTENAPVVDIERFVERHLKAELDLTADLDDGVLGETAFFADRSPKVQINRSLTEQVIDDDDCAPGIRGRWRATIAHEASHVLLHRHLVEFGSRTLNLFEEKLQARAPAHHRCNDRQVTYQRVVDPREYQANLGMAALLMPRKLFVTLARQEMKALGYGDQAPAQIVERIVPQLAATLHVSKQAARIRFDTLQLVSVEGQETL